MAGYNPDTTCRSNTTGTTPSEAIDRHALPKLAKAIRDQYKPLPAPKDSYYYFDLNIAGVCGPNGFAGATDNYLAQATNYFVVRESRAVALTVTVKETNNADAKPIEIPLLVARPDNNSKPTVDCSRVIRSNYQRGTVLKLTFNFYVSRDKYEVQGVFGKVTKFFAALLSLESKTFSVAGAAASKVFLGDIDKIVAATNELLLAFEKKTDDTVTLDIVDKEGGVAIPVGKKTSIRIVKAPKDTILYEGPVFTGGNIPAIFKNVTGQDYGAVLTNMQPDPTKLNSSATDQQRRDECSRIRNRFGALVVGKDQLLLVYTFLKNSAPTFSGHTGYNCLEPSEARTLSAMMVKLPKDDREPYEGAYKQAMNQAPPRPSEDRKLFELLQTKLEALAPQAKSAWLVRSIFESDPAKTAAFKAQMITSIAGFFDEQVSLDGANREPLMPAAVGILTAEETAARIFDWPEISRFGCFIPVATQAARDNGYIAELLVRVESKPFVIVHLQVKAVKQGSGAVISGVWAGKLGLAKARFAEKFPNGCGDKKPYWFPWKELDAVLPVANLDPATVHIARATRTPAMLVAPHSLGLMSRSKALRERMHSHRNFHDFRNFHRIEKQPNIVPVGI